MPDSLPEIKQGQELQSNSASGHDAAFLNAAAQQSALDPLSDGFSASGIYRLADGRELDMGVDWNESLPVRTRAVRRALKRRLGPGLVERSAPSFPSVSPCCQEIIKFQNLIFHESASQESSLEDNADICHWIKLRG